MHRLLEDQIKRFFGPAATQFSNVQKELEQLARQGALSPATAAVLNGLAPLLREVAATYVQNDRSLELKTQNLERTADELTQSNAKLREELASRKRAMDSLRSTALGLMEFVDLDDLPIDDDNLESLSTLMSELVRQKEESQKDLHAALTDLAHQKFALDQHAIVSTTDVQGIITYANDKFCQIGRAHV